MKKVLLLIVFAVVIALFFSAGRNGEQSTAGDPTDAPASSRLAELLSDDAESGFPKVLEPRSFRFPDDHGPHPEFRNEWWYVTGNLDGDGGERFGFELTLFRFSLTPEPLMAESDWRTNQVYIGHFAITDASRQEFRVAERYARGSLGLAGATTEPFRVWLEDWEIAANPGGQWRLVAVDEEFAIELTLAPAKPPVLNGIDGLSQKSTEPGNASYYYSMTRLDTAGTVRLDERTYRVAGLSWIDREWGSSALSAEQVGWDWFALQLDDGSELMFYSLRRSDGSQDVMSAGTFVTADGDALHLLRGDVSVESLDFWDSPAGGRYPSRWQLNVTELGLTLDVQPVMAAQELDTNVRYWEGAVDVAGVRDDRAVTGRGYVELTGYADALDRDGS